MFNNLVNLHDFVVLAEKLRKEGARNVISKVIGNEHLRVKKSWEHTQTAPIHWWDIPAVEKRWNLLITGDQGIDSYTYISNKYFLNKRDLKAISLGCGSGARELRWAKASKELLIDAYDLSEERISFARANAEKEGFSERVKYHVANVYDLELGAGSYDVVFTEGSLHHFSPLTEIVEKVDRWLKADALFIVNEFVGPSRFQWTRRQTEIVNSLLSILPERFKKKYDSGSIKSKVYRPGKLSMLINDPSEAAESSTILQLLHTKFDVVELKEYGGTILQLLFKDIAHNFINDDFETQSVLQFCFDTEDKLMQLKEIKSDFVFCVCKKRNMLE